MRGRKENATYEAAAGRDIFPVAIFEKACYNSLQTCGYSSSVERQLPKLHRWVRLPLAAPARRKRHIACDEFLCSALKTRLALILLLLAFDCDSLCWIRSRGRISKLSMRYMSEQSPLCSDVLLFLRNKRASSARSLAPPFQPRSAAQPLAALPPYGCGVPLAGAALGSRPSEGTTFKMAFCRSGISQKPPPG